VHTDHVASRPDSPLSEVVSTNAILLALASQNIRISASQLKSMTAEAKSKNRKIKNSAKGKENRRSKAHETHNTVLQQYEVQMAGKRTRYQRSTVPLPPEPKIFRGRATRALSDMSTLKEKVAKAMEATRQHNRNIIIAAQQQQPSSDAAHEQAPQSSVIEPIAVNSQLQPPDPLLAQPSQHDAPLIDPPQVLVAIASSEAKENNEDDTSSRKKKNSKRKKFQAGVTCLCSDVRAEKEKRVKKHDELIASWTEESKLSIVVYQQQVELNQQQVELNRLAINKATEEDEERQRGYNRADDDAELIVSETDVEDDHDEEI